MNDVFSNEIENVQKPYPVALLDLWKKGNYTMLADSQASDYIKDIILSKVSKRQGKRFFGEAYIASTTEMSNGWYNSYKWLTAKKWLTGKGLKNAYENRFHKALIRYIGRDLLSELQSQSKSYFESNKRLFLIDGVYRKPVAPDLWLIDNSGRYFL